jgi:mannose-6-phosphate isomerase
LIRELLNTIQPYAWGSRTALAELRGEPTPTAAPEAELWMGAHPLAPSQLAATGQSLPAAIDEAPEKYLGADVVGEHGAKLPFLLKVLAAATPLSLQAHPSIAQAVAGFAADEAQGLPLGSPARNYKDQNHKPELLCALGEFWALCGFREVSETLELLDGLGVAELLPYRALLAEEPNEIGISKAFSALMQAPAALRQRLSQVTTAACQAHAGEAGRFADELSWAARLGELYPGDVGVVSALLLNLVRLEAGEAVYLPAGNLHAYLGGTGVEIMASSDNVLRGGLTPKHVNVPELLHVLDFRPLRLEPLRAVAHGAEHAYETPAREFRLSYFDLADGQDNVTVQVDGPEIWLVTQGACVLEAATSAPQKLAAGRSAFVSADTGALRLSGIGRIFRARVAHSL